VYTTLEMVRAMKSVISATPIQAIDIDTSIVKPKKVYEKKVKAIPSTVVDVPVVVSEETVAVDETVSEDDKVVIDNTPAKMAEFSLKLQQVISLLSATKLSFKALEKIVVREFKVSQKASSKKSKRSGNRQPSGFVRPTLISEELALFLGKEVGTEMARTSVSKEINQYIRTNQLQDKSNGRQINADASLTTLLKLEPGDVLTYFNLQRYMKHHFVKVTPPEVVAPVVV
jgi:hypothetical protein